MTQSGASQAIAQLEDSMGAPLFLRERRRTVPTALGLQAVAEARLMLASLDRLRALARQARGEAGGTLRLASLPIVFSTILPPLLRRFRQAHPGIEVVPLEASDHEIETLLAAGTVDLGVVLNAPPDSGVCPLGEDDWWPWCPPRIRWRADPAAAWRWPTWRHSPSCWPPAAQRQRGQRGRAGRAGAVRRARHGHGMVQRLRAGARAGADPPENRRGLRCRWRPRSGWPRGRVDTPAVRALFATLQAHDGLA